MMPNGRNIGKVIYLFGAAESLLPEWRCFRELKTIKLMTGSASFGSN